MVIKSTIAALLAVCSSAVAAGAQSVGDAEAAGKVEWRGVVYLSAVAGCPNFSLDQFIRVKATR